MRKSVKNIIVTLLFLAMSLLLALLIYLYFFAADNRDISGEWTAELDMTKQAAVSALIWLQDIEAVSVSLEDVEDQMPNLTVRVNMTLEQSARSEGSFYCHIVPESYDECNRAAYEAFAVVFRELLTERLLMAGYAGGTDEETIEALVTESFGMSTVSYLMSCGPALLPPLEDLQAKYDGSGTYETAEGILTRRFDVGEPAAVKSESYIREESNLILTGEIGEDTSEYYPVMYILN